MQLKTYHHLQTYSAVSELCDLISVITRFELITRLLTAISGSVQNLFAYLSTLGLFVRLWNWADSLVDGWLNAVEKKFPKIKTVSFISLYETMQHQCGMIKAAVGQWATQVSNHMQLHLKWFDPVLKVSNDFYEYLLHLMFPSSVALGKDPDTNPNEEGSEYHRMVCLFKETSQRINMAAKNIGNIPSHVTVTYQNELKETKSTTQAVTKTTRKLSNDAYQLIKPTLDKVVGLPSTKDDGNGTTTKKSGTSNSGLSGHAETSDSHSLIDVDDSMMFNVKTATGVEVH